MLVGWRSTPSNQTQNSQQTVPLYIPSNQIPIALLKTRATQLSRISYTHTRAQRSHQIPMNFGRHQTNPHKLIYRVEISATHQADEMAYTANDDDHRIYAPCNTLYTPHGYSNSKTSTRDRRRHRFVMMMHSYQFYKRRTPTLTHSAPPYTIKLSSPASPSALDWNASSSRKYKIYIYI